MVCVKSRIERKDTFKADLFSGIAALWSAPRAVPIWWIALQVENGAIKEFRTSIKVCCPIHNLAQGLAGRARAQGGFNVPLQSRASFSKPASSKQVKFSIKLALKCWDTWRPQSVRQSQGPLMSADDHTSSFNASTMRSSHLFRAMDLMWNYGFDVKQLKSNKPTTAFWRQFNSRQPLHCPG